MDMRYVVLLAAMALGGCTAAGLSAQDSNCCEMPAGMECFAVRATAECSAECEPCAADADCCDGLACNKRGYCAPPTTR
jgi:hypothetical protein